MKTVNIEKQSMPSENGNTEITAVLTEGTIKDLAAYIGIGSEEWVKANGRKLSYREALMYFPFIKEENYRR